MALNEGSNALRGSHSQTTAEEFESPMGLAISWWAKGDSNSHFGGSHMTRRKVRPDRGDAGYLV